MYNQPTDPLQALLSDLQILPGVGQRTAQRMALHLLERERDGARRLSATLQQAMDQVKHCERCRNYTVESVCHICANPRRQQQTCCVVETPADVFALEQSGVFDGVYFVLLGRLSPLDGIGPGDLGLDLLQQHLDEQQFSELIIATNSSIEGEATAYYIQEMVADKDVNVSRLAQGVPLGGELEYIDRSTLALAINNRKTLSNNSE